MANEAIKKCAFVQDKVSYHTIIYLGNSHMGRFLKKGMVYDKKLGTLRIQNNCYFI